MEITWVDPAALIPYENNAKTHPPEQVKRIAESIKQFGWQQPIVVGRENVVIIGHGRLLAAKELLLDEVPVVCADTLTEEQAQALRLADNKTNESPWDFGKCEEELAALAIAGFDMTAFGFDDLAGADPHETSEPVVKLTDRFIIPPFSVLDARQGYWQDRKKAWKAKIGDKGQARDVAVYSGMENWHGGAFADASILDPVLSELACKWFMPGTGNAFDTFAGDTVFGYVAASLGNHFTGIELRKEQADFNQAACAGLDAEYICDDGRNVLDHIGEGTQDLFFSCPPYFDLEQYSDLPNDASNQDSYEDFYAIIDAAFTAAIKCLKDNRFAVVVCGDVRNKKTGEYYGFPDDIKATFKRNGMPLYNELVLVDHVGTARLRAVKYMQHRKVVKVHQNVLVFYKGDAKHIKDNFPEIEVETDAGEDMEF